MSSLVKVASNLFMPSEDSFGIYNREIVHRLLVNIQNNFSLLLEQPIDTSVYYFIDYRPGNPECCKIPNGFLIFLSSREDEFWRWVFQFSHEYCHSLINGTLSGEIYGLLWFEETICHLSSIYQLNNLIAISHQILFYIVTRKLPICTFSGISGSLNITVGNIYYQRRADLQNPSIIGKFTQI